jgi:hypothetical protein
MPGMDMPESDMPGASHGHGQGAGAVASRPLAPVLGSFGGGTVAVMLSAGFLRRRDRAASLAKRAARAAGRNRR